MDNLVVTVLAGGVYLGAGFVSHALLKREAKWEALGVPLGCFLVLLLSVSTLSGAFGGYRVLGEMLGSGALGPFASVPLGGVSAVAGVAGGAAGLVAAALPAYRPATWSFAVSAVAAWTWVYCGWALAA